MSFIHFKILKKICFHSIWKSLADTMYTTGKHLQNLSSILNCLYFSHNLTTCSDVKKCLTKGLDWQNFIRTDKKLIFLLHILLFRLKRFSKSVKMDWHVLEVFDTSAEAYKSIQNLQENNACILTTHIQLLKWQVITNVSMHTTWTKH